MAENISHKYPHSNFNLEIKQSIKSTEVSSKVCLPSMEIDDEEAQCESFCKLFLIYGLDHRKFAEDGEEKYEILGSYPDLSDKQVREDNRYIQDLELVCFPEIKKTIDKFDQNYTMNDLCRANYFHFISTNEAYQMTYITSVHFKEILLCERGAFVIPKAICVASKQPIFSL